VLRVFLLGRDEVALVRIQKNGQLMEAFFGVVSERIRSVT
jgi:hypothetical protein